MAGFFILLYRFFSKRRALLIVLLLATLLSAVYFASKIQMEEDISKASSGNNHKLSFVVKHLKTSEKIIFSICLADSTVLNPDKLVSLADEFTDSLKSTSFSTYIKEITGKLNDSAMSKVMDIFYTNLPIFLSKSDYVKIDSLIAEKSIKYSLEKNYRTLLSPSGFVLKKFIKRDPVGISAIVFDKLKQLQFDTTYEIYDGYIFTKGRKNLLLFMNPVFSSNKTSENTLFFEQLDKLINSFHSKYQSGINIEYFGAAAVAVGNAYQIKKDIMWSVSISILIILLFVAWYFRKISIPVLSFLPALFGGALALAIICTFKTNISIIALGIGSVLLGIIVDYALYLFSVYINKKSFEELLKDMSLTIVLCSLTSATAFLSLLFVKSEVLQDLGLFAALSVLGAAFFSLVFLPHFISSNKNIKPLRKTFIDRIVQYPFESDKIFVIAILLLTIISLFYYRKAGFEKDMNKLNFLSKKLALTEKKLNRLNDLSLKSIYLVSIDKNTDRALANDAKNAVILESLKQQNIISKYSSVSTLLISDSVQKQRIAQWETFWTYDKRKQLKETIFIYGDKIGFSKSAFDEFYLWFNKKFQAVSQDHFSQILKTFFADRITEMPEMAMVVTLIKTSSENRNKVFEVFSNQNQTVVFDKQCITDSFVENINTDFNILVELCLIFVTLVLIISFGRIEIGIIASVPMYLSWLLTLGAMGILGLTFNIFNIIISTFVFGLGVDYSILMIRGLLLEFKYGRNELSSYKTSIFLSSFTTVVGVGVLIIAKHPALHSIALIAVIGLLSVVIVSYTIEPILFRFFTTVKAKRRRLPVVFSDLVFTFIAFTIFIFGCLTMNILLPFLLILPVSKKTKKLIMHYLMMGFCRFEIYFMFNVKKRIVNPDKEDFRKPALIVANHQSHIDLLLLLMLNPKIIVLTNKWVWNNPVYSMVIRYLDFYHIEDGYENIMEKLKNRIEDGYSILVFPEGSRSEDSKIKRFHKGAFVIAERLKLDIVPIVIHGAGDCMNKGENHLKNGTITMKIFNRINSTDSRFENDYSILTKSVLKFFRTEYTEMNKEFGTPKYYRNKLMKNYIYKGPVLEWYVKVKLKLEKNYELFNSLIPRDASVIDIGCGYGYLSYMLNFVSEKRKITGIDYDKNKIDLANNCISKNDQVNFIFGDALNVDFEKTDVFILSDILHYLSEERQKQLIEKCINHLNNRGIIIIRDADKELKKRHLGTVLTELFSTKSGFNKTVEKLVFTSSDKIKGIASANGMMVEVLDNTKLTSNIVYVVKSEKS